MNRSLNTLLCSEKEWQYSLQDAVQSVILSATLMHHGLRRKLAAHSGTLRYSMYPIENAQEGRGMLERGLMK